MKWFVCLLAGLLVAAAPATKPATTIYELRKQVEALQSEVASLRSEVETLRAQIQPASPATQQAKGTENKPAVGMSLDELNKAMGSSGRLQYENADGTSQYQWNTPYEFPEVIPDTHGQTMMVTKYGAPWHVTLQNGKAIAVARY